MIKKFFNTILFALIILNSYSQVFITKQKFVDKYKVKHSANSINNLGREHSWAFAFNLFIESEVLRNQKQNINLSENYLLYSSLKIKTQNYFKHRGYVNFTPISLMHDGFILMDKYGILPETVYEKNKITKDKIQKLYKELLQNITLYNQNNNWDTINREAIYKKIDDAFSINSKENDSQDFYKSLNLSTSDYIGFTSRNNLPLYTQNILGLYEDWSMYDYFNLTNNEYYSVIDLAMHQNFSVLCYLKITDNDFFRRGKATMFNEKLTEDTDINESRNNLIENYNEKNFYNFHIIGISYDNGDNKYYKAQSFDQKTAYGGYIYISEKYLKANALFILLNKKAVNPILLERLIENKEKPVLVEDKKIKTNQNFQEYDIFNENQSSNAIQYYLPLDLPNKDRIKIALSKEYENGRYENWLKNSDSNIKCIDLHNKSIKSATKQLESCSALVLTGGLDVNPKYYNMPNEIGRCRVDGKRDEMEFALIKKAIELKMPILAICRGHQILNVALGGSLVVDIPTDVKNGITHQCPKGQKCYHNIQLTNYSFLKEFVNDNNDLLEVNSYHHQGIKNLANGLKSIAKTQDGIIEAFLNDPQIYKSFLLGVQWHPELMKYSNNISLKIAEIFIKAAEEYKKKY